MMKKNKTAAVEFIPGPLTSEMQRADAERTLRTHPAIQKGAAYALEQMDGRWVAAIVHMSAPAPFAGGGPADADEESPGPKSYGPDDAEPSEGEDMDDSDEGDAPEGPPDLEDKSKKKKKKGDKNDKKILELLEAIVMALGIAPPSVASPDNSSDGDLPPGVPPLPSDDKKRNNSSDQNMHIYHDRVTKPGETPPGGTPIGAPAFASIRADHPWSHVANKAASFFVEEKVGDESLSKIRKELSSLSKEIGYRLASLKEIVDDDGDRAVIGVITMH